MSPEPTTSRAGRVIRGRVATGASTLAFPTIEAVESSPAARGPSESMSAAEVRPARRPPAVDPAELERARLEASSRGYADGLAAGRDEARAEVHASARGLLDELGAAVQEHRTKRERSFDELTEDVVEFALATVEALLGRELALAANPLRDAVQHALRLAPDRTPAVVLLHPTDVDLIGPVDELAGARSIEVVGDATVQPGGCLVRAGECEIDAQIEASLARLREVLQ
jgi:flagellar assembly protein FliH